jgi:Hemerythrin HHE cation binding domain
MVRSVRVNDSEPILVIRILSQDYHEIDQLCANLIVTNTRIDQERLRDRLDSELGRLFAAQETVTYKAIAQVGFDTEIVQPMLLQHEQLRQAVATLKSHSPDGLAFENAVKALRPLLSEHVADLEQLVFPIIRTQLAKQHDSLAIELEAQRQLEHGAFGA